MKLQQWAAASVLAVSALSAQAAVVAPGGDLGTLGTSAELFGSFAAGAGTEFSNDYLFSLDGLSTVSGSVAEFFGSVSFSAVKVGSESAILASTNTGYSFSFANLAAGSYTLTVEGSMPVGFNGYTGSIMAQPVPEPQSVAMLLAGLGVMGAMAARRRKAD